MALHGERGAEYRTAGGSAWRVDFGGLSRPVQGAFRSGGDDGLGRRPSQNVAGLGTPFERGLDGRFASSHAAARLGSGHRLASVAVLRAASPQSQRTLLREASTRNQEVSCLRLGLHCQPRASLYGGADLG